MDERDTTNQMEDTADEARGQAWHSVNRASDQARDYARDMKGRVSDNARGLAHQAREQVSQQAQHLRERGEGLVDAQKGRAAEEVSHLSGAIRSAAEQLRQNQNAGVAGYADSIAQQLDGAADYLRSRDLMGLFNDAQGFARRRPEVVLGGMFLAGLAIARFLKASTDTSVGSGSYGAADSYGGRDEFGGYSGYRTGASEGNAYRGGGFEADSDFSREAGASPIGTLGAQYGTAGLAGGLDHVDRSEVPDANSGLTSTSADADITNSSDITSGTNPGGAPSVQP